MDKTYDFVAVEKEILKFWEANGYFNGRHTGGKKFSLVMPLPNVTGKLHIGHALNNTLQDILVRWKRMNGYETMWVPGTDHAGIATQQVVEKKLAKENKYRRSMSKKEFLDEIWKWTREYGGEIVSQLKNLGCSCNWERQRFTLDPEFCRLVRKIFVDMYGRGLIYRGKYITNWCERCQTVLADEEVVDESVLGEIFYIRYKMEVGEGDIVIATTRPEMLFANTAVGISSSDDTNLVGKRCIVPIVNRSVPIIWDKTISDTNATGKIPITPAHDKKHYLIATRHKLDIINILDKDNKLLKQWEKFGFSGKILSIRGAVVDALDKLGLLVKREKYICNTIACYRCNNPIEYSISDQFYVRTRPLTEPIKETTCGFYPAFQKSIFNNWVNNMNDWCISRQIVWGHEIPAWYCENVACQWINVSELDIKICENCGGSSLRKDTDVLDTWFSSWLWAFGVFDDNAALSKFFPLDVVITGSDILFFWIIKMMMAGMEFKGVMPFKDIFLHGIVRDKDGIKMAKTLGNVIDPADIIREFGTDALRFTLVFMGSATKDITLDPKSFKIGKALVTKLWNATRYILMKATQAKQGDTTESASIIMFSLEETKKKTEAYLNDYDFHQYAKTIYSFFFDEFCSIFLENTKKDTSSATFKVLSLTFLAIIKLFHPILPFVTEKIYQQLKKIGDLGYTFKDSIMVDC
ncbi:MAG: valine--tRNA ligase [Harvfovirus sp.]|uniref:valine--tRNA ligase n=1 Tax=Harvfovirus sp. TaxID=2487768 RepID=A0A3G5A5C0_9VIRU|nr:MAG: valine--tRNA ligase [Harvfovirus sp.]